MDIDLLSKLIGEVILDNDRVGLPGLGDFVAEIVPATFSDKGHTINPPYRKVYFRKGACSNNLLTQHYSKTFETSLEEAEEIISSFTSEMGAVLLERKLIIFPGLGRLRATKENHIFFVADECADAHPSDIAMEPISLKSKGDESVSFEEEITSSEEEEDSSAAEEMEAAQLDFMSYTAIMARKKASEEEKKKKNKLSYIKSPNARSTAGSVLLYVTIIFSLVALAMAILLAFFPHSGLTEWLLYNKEQLEVIHYFDNIQKMQ